MKTLVTFILMSFLLSVAGTAGAQDKSLFDKLYSDIVSSCVSLDYTYDTEVSGIRMTGNHSLEVQGKIWHLEGNGIEAWCDGESVWTTDPDAKEVIVEPVSDDDQGALTNPALLLTRLKDWFEVRESRNSADGKTILYILFPKADINIEYFNLNVRKSDGTIVSGSFAMDDGNAVTIKVASMVRTQKKPESYFRPSQSFDSSWIVTDLR